MFVWTKCNISILNTTFANNQAAYHDELCRNKNLLTVPRGGTLAVKKCNLYTIFNSNHANRLGHTKLIFSFCSTARMSFWKIKF